MRPIWQGGLIMFLVGLAYFPAWHGGFVWDDDAWTTGIIGLLRETAGLRLMWFEPTALQQYYPLTGTSFWLDYQLWQFWTLPYHLENILLHAVSALLLWRLLLRLQLPGAWLAAAIFALHPVMVESVAWITERKNVLSLAFYLGAGLAYLRYAQGGQWSVVSSQRSVAETKTAAPVPDSSTLTRHASLFYGLAFVLFLCALLAKTTTFSLPAVILLITWWKRGQIRWREDVLPTLPFFALALGLCAITAWLEETRFCAQGAEFDLTFPQRSLIAGRAFWFYLGHLFWPANLGFIYPRWQPIPGLWWQWLYPATALGALLALWLARRRLGRGSVTALLYFAGTLFPVLGFMNAYGMRFSLVWDHWVYLSAPGIFALTAALVMRLAEKRRQPALVYGFGAIVLPGLALLTWQQAGIYRDAETLWQTTLARNPDCWMAHNNLGLLLMNQGHAEEAVEHYRQAIRINPHYTDALNSLGIALAAGGRLEEAADNFRQATRIDPNDFKALNNLGIALAAQGRLDEAIENYYRAIQVNPNYYEAHNNLGATLAAKGRFDEATRHYRQAIRINPNYAKALNNLGVALANLGRADEAAGSFRRALQINPNYVEAANNLARVTGGK
jgi:protein O-mannosyl-transferase